MALFRMRHDWNQTADLMALVANVNRGKDARAFGRDDFHPMTKTHRQRGVRITPDTLKSMRGQFLL